ncbi:MAG: lipoyl synthase [Candidatus Omnitrophica bacterium]|nr:lipoyl synthase [Candidatus Omnitrophota bacterium]
MTTGTHFPTWLRKRIENTHFTREILKDLRINTVCESARCPNLLECFSRHRATFMILGEICTRRCTFCAIPRGIPSFPEESEPERIVEAIRRMKLSHAVITSPARDDLEDGGSIQFAKVITAIHREFPEVTVEVLTPDFHGELTAIERVVQAGPQIYNHNLETVKRLQRKLRPYARYERSLEILRQVKVLSPRIWTKSGLMVGVGEEEEEVLQTLKDLRESCCEMLTIGQYLQSDEHNLAVAEFIPPEKFQSYEEKAYALGFSYVFSGPFVRSSYWADAAKQNLTFLR